MSSSYSGAVKPSGSESVLTEASVMLRVVGEYLGSRTVTCEPRSWETLRACSKSPAA